MMSIPLKPARYLRNLLFSQSHPACVFVSPDLTVSDWYGPFDHYGIKPLVKHKPVQDQLDFMVGLEFETSIHYPAIETPNGKYASINCLSGEDHLAILIVDVTNNYRRNQELQQKANEVQLLNEQLHSVMIQLANAQQKLTDSNELLEREYNLQGKFLASVSHEFRTPLTSILGYSDLIAESEVDYKKLTQYSKAISRGAKHLLSMIENILDHGRLMHDEVVIQTQPTVISDLLVDIKMIFSPLANANKLDFSVIVKQGVPQEKIEIDEMRVRQCLINLVGNAIKYTEAGSVKLDVDYRDGYIEFVVNDTGPGIDPTSQGAIFEAFSQLPGNNAGGSGLGLNISKQLVELMGGTMIFSSRLGHGTQAGFNLPAMVVEHALHAERSAQQVVGKTTVVKVLIAEDDSDISILLDTILSAQGYEVISVSDGLEAINKVKSHNPDLILMDINMPRLGGLAATRQIREAGYQKVILAMTASSLESDISKALASGCDDCLLKPIDSDHLNQVVARYATQN